MKEIVDRLTNFGKSYWGVLVLVALWLLVLVTNSPRGVWLMGWDSVQPELALDINLKRVLFGAWQEYRGLGLPTGMAEAADLSRILLLYVVKLFAPVRLVRWVWLFGMLLLGSLGAYSLFKRMVGKSEVAAVVVGMFYLLNPATVQMSFVPLETFISFFGFLPWLLWVSYDYLVCEKTSPVKLLIVSFLATSAFYVQTMFLVWMMVLVIMAGVMLVFKKTSISKVLIAGGLTLVVNSFWLLPITYSAINTSHVPVMAKANRLSTPENILQQNSRGGFLDAVMLLGNPLDLSDVGVDGVTHQFIMSVWQDWLGNPVIILLGLGLFTFSIIGMMLGIRDKKSRSVAVMLLVFLVLAWVMLARKVIGFGQVYELLSAMVPLFGQLFRSTFTKFSTLASLVLALGLGLGVVKMASKKVLEWGLAVGLMVVILAFISPIFQGGLIYSGMRVQLPDEYLELFDWFEGQDKNGRIVQLPMQSFWGWDWTDWGYRGSGFLWYGLEQPLMNRAFDVWSSENETFYHQFSTALYSCSAEGGEGDCTKILSQLLSKYDISYVLFDEHSIIPGKKGGMISQSRVYELMNLLEAELVYDDRGLLVWIVDDLYESDGSDLYELVDVDPLFTLKDVVYQTVGDYISDSEDTISKRYPFADSYKEKLDNVSYVDSGFGTDVVVFESDKVLLYGEGVVTTPGMAFGFSLNMGGEVSYIDDELLVELSPGSRVSWNDELLSEDLLKKRYVIPVGKGAENLLVSVGDEVVSVSRGEVMSLQHVATVVGEPLAIKVYDAGLGKLVDTEPTFGIDQPLKCWEREGVDSSWIDSKKNNDYVQFTVNNASACLPLRVGLETGEVGMMQIIQPYRSEEAKPQFCVTRDDQEYRCLQKEIFYQEKPSSDWTQVSRYVEKAAGANYWVDVVARGSDVSDQVWSIDYKNPKILFYPEIASLVLGDGFWNEYLRPQKFSVEGVGVVKIEMELEPELINSGLYGLSEVKNCDVFERGLVDRVMVDQNDLGDEQNASAVVYSASGKGVACDSVVQNDMSTYREQILRIVGENVSGRSMKFLLNNLATNRNDLEQLLSSGDFDESFGLLAWPEHEEDGYVINFETRSFGEEESMNRLEKVLLYPVNLGWLSRIRVESLEEKDAVKKLSSQIVKKWGTSHYLVQVDSILNESGEGLGVGIVSLEQGYDEGWNGYLMRGESNGVKMLLSWWFGESLEQVKVNGWANGFLISDNSTSEESSDLQSDATVRGESHVVIVYWPQYLQWLGFVILLAVGGCLGWKVWKDGKQKKKSD